MLFAFQAVREDCQAPISVITNLFGSFCREIHLESHGFSWQPSSQYEKPNLHHPSSKVSRICLVSRFFDLSEPKGL